MNEPADTTCISASERISSGRQFHDQCFVVGLRGSDVPYYMHIADFDPI